MARSRRENQREMPTNTARGNVARQMETPDAVDFSTTGFPMVETGDHLTGELFDPMAQTEESNDEPQIENADNQQLEAAPVAEAGQPQIDDPRFAGKDPVEILKSYKELEKKFHERDEEIGNYRKMFDQQVQQNFNKPAQQVKQPVDEKENQKLLEEMLANPQGFMQKVEQRILGNLGSLAAQHELQAIQAKHKEITSQPEFKEWLINTVPMHIAQLADNDPKTYNWIVNQYQSAKAPQKAAASAREEATIKRRVAENAAGLPTATAPRGKQVYTRSSIMKLMRENPAEYERLQPDIMQAYREGRVK